MRIPPADEAGGDFYFAANFFVKKSVKAASSSSWET